MWNNADVFVIEVQSPDTALPWTACALEIGRVLYELSACPVAASAILIHHWRKSAPINGEDRFPVWVKLSTGPWILEGARD